MGREIEIQLRDSKDKILYSDYLCGRDPATTFIANLVSARYYGKEGSEASPEEDDCGMFVSYNLRNKEDLKKVEEIKAELRSYAESDLKEKINLKSTLADAKAARRNCLTINAFIDFNDYIKAVQEDLDYWEISRAEQLLSMLDKCYSIKKKFRFIGKTLYIRIILSE